MNNDYPKLIQKENSLDEPSVDFAFSGFLASLMIMPSLSPIPIGFAHGGTLFGLYILFNISSPVVLWPLISNLVLTISFLRFRKPLSPVLIAASLVSILIAWLYYLVWLCGVLMTIPFLLLVIYTGHTAFETYKNSFQFSEFFRNFLIRKKP